MQTLRDESIEILSTSRHYQRGNVTYFQYLTIGIHTKKGRELSLEKKKKSQWRTKSEQDPSRTDQVQNLSYDLISRGEIDAVLSRVQSCSVEMWKKSISNSSVCSVRKGGALTNSSATRIKESWLWRCDSTSKHELKKSKGQIRERNIFPFPSRTHTLALLHLQE